MRGLYLDGQGLRFRRDLPEPELAPGHALVRVERAGICSTDLQLIKGMYAFSGIPGHEFVGIVEEIHGEGDAERSWAGRRVVGAINLPCGNCDLCLRGLGKHCRQRNVLGIRNHNGAFAEYLSLPATNLYSVPDEVETDSAVLAEPLAAAFDILDRFEPEPGNSVAIVGDGRLAQLAARVLLDADLKPSVFGKHAEKLQRLPEQVRKFDNLPAELTRTFDVVVECSGSASGVATAFQLVRPAGRVVLKSTIADHVALPTEAIVVNELSVVGSRCGDFERALAYLSVAQKKDQALSNLVDAHFMIDEGVQAVEFASSQPVIKVVLNMT